MAEIRIAAQNGNNAEILRLVSSGADIDSVYFGNYENKLPLTMALSEKHYSTVLLLLDLGANPRVPRESGNFYDWLLHRSWDLPHRDMLNILQKLKEKGHYVHGARYSTILGRHRRFVGDGGEELLTFLLEEGANPCEQGSDDQTVLFQHLNQPSIVKLLRSYGADVFTLKRWSHHTAREYIDTQINYSGLRLDDPDATIKALTDPVELKFPRSSGMQEKIEGLESQLQITRQQLNLQDRQFFQTLHSMEQSSKQAIERLESKLLACGQSLETCESEKASMRSQLTSLEADMATISERLERARGASRDDNRTIDDLIRAKTALEQTIRLLRAAVDDGLLTTNSLKAMIAKLQEDIRILREAAGARSRESPEPAPRPQYTEPEPVPDPQPTEPEPVPDPQPTRGFECRTPYNRSTTDIRQRLKSCVPAEGGVFDNIRTAMGGRFTNRQKCVEQCYIP